MPEPIDRLNPALCMSVWGPPIKNVIKVEAKAYNVIFIDSIYADTVAKFILK